MLECGSGETDEKKCPSCPKLLRAVGANSKKGRDFLNLAVNKTFALGSSPAFLGSPGDFDHFGLTVANTDVREGKPLGIHIYERGGVQLVVGAAPALAEGTGGVELVGGAERATTAKPEALGPGAYGEAGCGHETPLQGEAGHEIEMPLQEGEQELDALLRKDEYKVNVPP